MAQSRLIIPFHLCTVMFTLLLAWRHSLHFSAHFQWVVSGMSFLWVFFVSFTAAVVDYTAHLSYLSDAELQLCTETIYP